MGEYFKISLYLPQYLGAGFWIHNENIRIRTRIRIQVSMYKRIRASKQLANSKLTIIKNCTMCFLVPESGSEILYWCLLYSSILKNKQPWAHVAYALQASPWLSPTYWYLFFSVVCRAHWQWVYEKEWISTGKFITLYTCIQAVEIAHIEGRKIPKTNLLFQVQTSKLVTCAHIFGYGGVTIPLKD